MVPNEDEGKADSKCSNMRTPNTKQSRYRIKSSDTEIGKSTKKGRTIWLLNCYFITYEIHLVSEDRRVECHLQGDERRDSIRFG